MNTSAANPPLKVYHQYASSPWTKALLSLPEKDQSILLIQKEPAPKVQQILDDISKALETQRDRCKRGKWKTISIGGKELIIRDVCARIASHIQKFMGVIDIAVSYDPAHAALPWAGVRLVLQLSVATFEAFEAVVEGLDKAAGIISRTAIIEALSLGGNVPLQDSKMKLREELVKLYSTVLAFFCKAKKHHDSSMIKRAVSLHGIRDSVNDMEIAEQVVLIQHGLVDSERMKDMSDNITHMNLAIISTADGVVEIQTRLEAMFLEFKKPMTRAVDQSSDLHLALKENDRSELLRWLSTACAREHYREALESLLPGSGEWLVNHSAFIDWMDTSASETFWLKGIPGCGKTKLAAAVTQHLGLKSSNIESPTPTAHFFCARNPAEPERGDARAILRSLVKQLSLTKDNKSLRRSVVEKFQKRRKEASHDGENLGVLTVEECTELLCELGRDTPLIIIIDALDECNSKQRITLLESFDKLRQRSRDIVKIFISSRHEEDISSYCSKGAVMCVTNEDGSKKDLKHFITSQVEAFVKRWATTHHDTTENLRLLKKELITRLIAGADGMFMWVALQLECISDADRIKDIDAIRQALKSLPSTLSRSYEAIHARIQAMGTKSRSVAIKALKLLVSAKRNLATIEFIAAVAKSSNSYAEISKSDIVEYCCHLVVVDNETDSFRLSHLTVREFLETLEDFSFPSATYFIAERCLGVYLYEGSDKDDFFKYAAQYWPVHVEELYGSPQRKSIESTLVGLFTKEEHFEDWIDSLEAIPLEERSGSGASWHKKLEGSLSDPPSPLFSICGFGFSEVLETPEVLAGLDVNQKNRNGIPGLYLAARWGHYQVATILLDHGADVNAPGYLLADSLQAAAFGGHIEIVQLLLDHGASSTSRKGEFSSSIQAALANGHELIAKMILSKGFVFSNQSQFDDALDMACFKGSFNLAQRLLTHQAEKYVSEVLPDPLQVALLGGQKREVKRLLQNYDHDSINRECGYFGNCLAAAIASRKLGLVKLMIESGARVDLRGRFGFPLRAAAAQGDFGIMQYLLERGADPNTKDEKLGDPLQVAASMGNLDIMLLLLRHNASVYGNGGHFGDTLQAASFSGYGEAVRLLLEYGAKLDHDPFDSQGKYHTGRYDSPLHAAITAGHEAIVEIILTAGAQVDQQMRESSTATGSSQTYYTGTLATEELATIGIGTWTIPTLRSRFSSGIE